MSGPAKVNKKEYLTNVKITKKYDVSAATVSRWMRLAREGKNNLQVLDNDNRFLVKDSEHNHAELRRLAKRGRKHRGTSSFKKIEPDSNFYEAFNDQHKYELIRSLMVDSEIPFKFARLGEGARIWSNLQKIGIRDKVIKAGSLDTQMLLNSASDIESSLDEDSIINIIEIGAGDFTSGPLLVDKLSEKYTVSNYLSVSFSSEILDIQKSFHQKNFPESDNLEYHHEVMDIERLILDEFTVKFKQENNKAINIVLLLGASLFNYTDYTSILHNLRKALFPEDFLIISNTVLSENSKVPIKSIQSSTGYRLLMWLPQSIGLDVSTNSLKYYFEEKSSTKNVYYVADKDYDIQFDTGQVVHIKKDQKISLVKQHLSKPLAFYTVMNEHGFNLYSTKISHKQSWFQSVFVSLGSNYL